MRGHLVNPHLKILECSIYTRLLLVGFCRLATQVFDHTFYVSFLYNREDFKFFCSID